MSRGILVAARRCPALPALAMIGVASLARAAEPSAAFSGRVERGGLVLETTVSRVVSADKPDVSLRSGDPVTVRFRVTDQSGKAISALVR